MPSPSITKKKNICPFPTAISFLSSFLKLHKKTAKLRKKKFYIYWITRNKQVTQPKKIFNTNKHWKENNSKMLTIWEKDIQEKTKRKIQKIRLTNAVIDLHHKKIKKVYVLVEKFKKEATQRKTQWNAVFKNKKIKKIRTEKNQIRIIVQAIRKDIIKKKMRINFPYIKQFLSLGNNPIYKYYTDIKNLCNNFNIFPYTQKNPNINPNLINFGKKYQQVVETAETYTTRNFGDTFAWKLRDINDSFCYYFNEYKKPNKLLSGFLLTSIKCYTPIKTEFWMWSKKKKSKNFQNLLKTFINTTAVKIYKQLKKNPMAKTLNYVSKYVTKIQTRRELFKSVKLNKKDKKKKRKSSKFKLYWYEWHSAFSCVEDDDNQLPWMNILINKRKLFIKGGSRRFSRVKRPREEKKNKIYLFYKQFFIAGDVARSPKKNTLVRLNQIIKRIYLPVFNHSTKKQLKKTNNWHVAQPLNKTSLALLVYHMNFAPTIYWATEFIRNGFFSVTNINQENKLIHEKQLSSLTRLNVNIKNKNFKPTIQTINQLQATNKKPLKNLQLLMLLRKPPTKIYTNATTQPDFNVTPFMIVKQRKTISQSILKKIFYPKIFKKTIPKYIMLNRHRNMGLIFLPEQQKDIHHSDRIKPILLRNMLLTH